MSIRHRSLTMKHLKLALLTLLMPLVAFAADPITINYYNEKESVNVSGFTVIKGEGKKWLFETSTRVYGTWTVVQKPAWLELFSSHLTTSNGIAFRGSVPTTATNTELKLKVEIEGETAPIEQTFTITVTDPQIQYEYRNPEGRWMWSNETTLNVIKGNYERCQFRTSSNLKGIWEEVSEFPDWFQSPDINTYINKNKQSDISIRGLVPEYAEDSYSFQLRVTDDSGSVATKTYNINVQTPLTPTITISSLEAGKVGESYFETLTTSSIYAQWSIASGSLPAGLELSSDGSIYGYPTTAGTSNFTVKSHNITGEDTKELSIAISAATAAPEFVEVYGNIYYDGDDNPIGAEYVVEEGVSYARFCLDRVATEVKIKSGSLPPGITLKRDQDDPYYICYIFSGNFTYNKTGSNEYTFVVEAKNSVGSNTQEFSFEVIQAEEAPIIDEYMSSPDEVYAGANYEAYLFVQSYVGATWSATGLPTGLALYPEGSTLYIKGAPATAGNFNVTVTATNSKGKDTKTFTIKVLQPQVPQITTNSPLPDGKIGLPYEEFIEANTEFATWRIASGSLPPGLTFESSDYGYSWIEGTPTNLGTYTFTIEAKNTAGTKTKAFTIVVKTPALPTISTTTLPDAKKGQGQYRGILVAADDAIWSKIGGSLPSGLKLNSSGYIGGIPSAAIVSGTTYTFTVKAENVSGSDTKQFTIKVVNPPAPTITTPVQLSGKAGQYLNIRFTADEYVNSWSITESNLPMKTTTNRNGFSFDDYGYLYGSVATAGTYTFKLTATNAGGTSEAKSFTLTIAMPAAPVISISSLPNGKVGQYYEQALTLSAGDDASWDIASGSLPSGLVLGFDGYVLEFDGYKDTIGSWMIKGTPTTAGTKTFTLRATNVSGSATKQLSITIAAASNGGGGGGGGGVTPINPSQTTNSNISIRATNNAIVLENLPKNTKVEVYNLQGKRIYSAYPENPEILVIGVQTGMYFVKVGSQTLRAVIK
jgi:PKD repeat protein